MINVNAWVCFRDVWVWSGRLFILSLYGLTREIFFPCNNDGPWGIMPVLTRFHTSCIAVVHKRESAEAINQSKQEKTLRGTEKVNQRLDTKLCSSLKGSYLGGLKLGCFDILRYIIYERTMHKWSNEYNCVVKMMRNMMNYSTVLQMLVALCNFNYKLFMHKSFTDYMQYLCNFVCIE